MKRILIALAASSALIGAAQAGDLNHRGSLKDPVERQGRLPEPEAPVERAISWTGFYIGGQVGWSNSNHNIEGQKFKGSCAGGDSEGTEKSQADCLDKSPLPGIWTYNAVDSVDNFSLDGINSSGVFGGVTIGADYQMNRVVFGVFADYNISDADFQQRDGSGEIAHLSSIEDGDSWVVAARAGYLFGSEKRALLYVLGGYGQQDVTFKGFGEEEDSKKDLTFSGFVAGAGAEYALSQNVFVGLEWQHFFGGKETLFSDLADGEECAHEITDDMSGDKVMAKLKVKLNSDLSDVLR